MPARPASRLLVALLLPGTLLLACTDAKVPTSLPSARKPAAVLPGVAARSGAPSVEADPLPAGAIATAAPVALTETPHDQEGFASVAELEGAQAASPFLAEIDSAIAELHPALKSPLPAGIAAALPPLRLPVLLPDDGKRLHAGHLSAEQDWYALSWHEDGATVLVQGTREGFESPDVPADFPTPTWRTPLVVRNELIVDATFVLAGASYLVSVECAQPETDVRCTKDKFVLGLVASLGRASTLGRAGVRK